MNGTGRIMYITVQTWLLQQYRLKISTDTLSCLPNDYEAMRKILLSVLMLMVLAGGSCSKSGNKNRTCSAVNAVAPANETAALKEYIDSNHIDAKADSRGFFYKIIDAGTGDHPNVCSSVVVTYSARLTNGTQADKGTNVPFDLSMLILGWQEGIPLIAKGGSIILYLPPSLAYGPATVGAIPANSMLVFTITLSSIY
jgi:FKBP-type peptidyl-prolyl cis-trans isomerase FkpA